MILEKAQTGILKISLGRTAICCCSILVLILLQVPETGGADLLGQDHSSDDPVTSPLGQPELVTRTSVILLVRLLHDKVGKVAAAGDDEQ